MFKKNKKNKKCFFCENDIKEIDYKDVRIISYFINTYKKILPRKKTNTCSKHQRKLATSIKRARIIALFPFVRE